MRDPRSNSHEVGFSQKENRKAANWQRTRKILIRCHPRGREKWLQNSSFAGGKHYHEVICSTKMGTTLGDSSCPKKATKESKMTITEICKTLNSNLTHLSIESRPLNRRFVKKFENCSMESLKTLSLNNNQLYRDKSSFRRLIQSLPKSLEELSLCWNGINESTSDTLARRMPSLKNVKKIRLCGNPLGGAGLGLLLEVGSLHRISQVDLCDCDIGNDGALRLAQFLSKPCTSIQRLTLKMNSIGENGAKFLADGLARNQSLVTLHMHCNEIDDEGVEALMTSLSMGSSALEELSLCANLISDIGTKAIARNLHTTRLKRLYLNHNVIGDEGIEHLVHALDGSMKGNRLEELALCSNGLGNKSATALALALQSNQSLLILELSGNPRIDRRGVSNFVKCLQVNKTLSTMQILENTYENHLLNEKLDFYLKRNHLFRNCMGNMDIPKAAWPHLISGVQRADVLFLLLQERPELF
jgi:Ran GTPase-activating protein (RanGAP) involved in mRNA processing and transport